MTPYETQSMRELAACVKRKLVPGRTPPSREHTEACVLCFVFEGPLGTNHMLSDYRNHMCAECGGRVKTDDRGEDVASFRACIHERKNLIFRT